MNYENNQRQINNNYNNVNQLKGKDLAAIMNNLEDIASSIEEIKSENEDLKIILLKKIKIENFTEFIFQYLAFSGITTSILKEYFSTWLASHGALLTKVFFVILVILLIIRTLAIYDVISLDFLTDFALPNKKKKNIKIKDVKKNSGNLHELEKKTKKHNHNNHNNYNYEGNY